VRRVSIHLMYGIPTLDANGVSTKSADLEEKVPKNN
jgi:hypothetical protein